MGGGREAADRPWALGQLEDEEAQLRREMAALEERLRDKNAELRRVRERIESTRSGAQRTDSPTETPSSDAASLDGGDGGIWETPPDGGDDVIERQRISIADGYDGAGREPASSKTTKIAMTAAAAPIDHSNSSTAHETVADKRKRAPRALPTRKGQAEFDGPPRAAAAAASTPTMATAAAEAAAVTSTPATSKEETSEPPRKQRRAPRQTDPNNLPRLKPHATRKYVYKCTVEGCEHEASRGGVCWSHGAKKYYNGKRRRKTCRVEGCTNGVTNNGVCQRHGAIVRRCSVEGCPNKAINGGVCFRHGAKVKKKLCTREGCTKQAIRWGVCFKHGANKLACIHEGCTAQAVKEDRQVSRNKPAEQSKPALAKGERLDQEKDPAAWMEKRPACVHEGCTAQAVKWEVCKTRMDGFCAKHHKLQLTKNRERRRCREERRSLCSLPVDPLVLVSAERMKSDRGKALAAQIIAAGEAPPPSCPPAHPPVHAAASRPPNVTVSYKLGRGPVAATSPAGGERAHRTSTRWCGGARMLDEKECGEEGQTLPCAQRLAQTFEKEFKAKTCKFEGCDNIDLKRGGLCKDHGKDSVEGCSNILKGGDIHCEPGAAAAAPYCSLEGCDNISTTRKGLCSTHGNILNSKVKICDDKGCNAIAFERGLCIEHVVNISEVVRKATSSCLTHTLPSDS